MNPDTRFAAWILWIAPFAALAALIGWETEWGNALRRAPDAAPAITPAPVPVSLYPDYSVQPADTRRETWERTLFNPTRRQAPPPAVADAAKPRMQRGQFTLAGTTLVGDKSIAFLRETQGGKPRTVRQGETINGMLVKEVKPDRVRLTLGDESEELLLKVAAGPRTTIQPVVAPPAPQAGGFGGAQPAPGQTVAGPGNASDIAAVLAERRRAARAAQDAAQGAAQAAGTPAQAAAVPSGPATARTAPAQTPSAAQPAQPASTWGDVYQRYQSRQPR